MAKGILQKEKGTTMIEKWFGKETADTIMLWLLAIIIAIFAIGLFMVFIRISAYSLEPF